MTSRQRQFGIVLMIPVVLTLILLLGLTGSRASSAGPPAGTAAAEASWHTFLGSTLSSSDNDQGYGAAVDSAGYVYVTGTSNNGEWGGTPITNHVAGLDGFLAQLDPDGALLWYTFVGGSETDSAQAVAIDAADHLFVVGDSTGGNWSTDPISAHHGSNDVFVARFDAAGARQWFTFVGQPDNSSSEYGTAIAVDSGGIYIGGHAGPNPYLAKLDSAGAFQWQRVITSTAGDMGYALGIATDQSGGVYLAGYADYGDWHNAPPPVRPHSGYPGQSDAFVAKFDGDDGALLWHTFLGAADWEDEGRAIVVTMAETTPTVYVAGWSAAGWGTPLQSHAGTKDAFVAQLNGSDGVLGWHTFMGNATYGDAIHALARDGEGRLFAAGQSRAGWGRPVIPHPGGGVGDAVFVAALSPAGHFLGNTFLGGAPSSDSASGITVSEQGTVYVAGSSSAGWNNLYWGSPIREFNGAGDAFVAGLGARSVVRYWIYAPLVLRDY